MLRANSNARGRRRARLPRTLITMALGSMLAASTAAGEDLVGQPPLTVVTHGGALERSKMRAVIRPYRKQTGRWVTVLEHHGGLETIAAQVGSENVQWDVVNLNLPDAVRGCRAGLLETIDPSALPAGHDGTPAQEDFYPAALSECGIGHSVTATVVAYDLDAFDESPTKIADFFDTRRFPGRRGLRRSPVVTLEWALLGDGVNHADLYSTLSTEKGLKRAFRSLDRIRKQLVWWHEGEEAPALIEQGIVTMSSAWNGRVDGANQRGGHIGIVWDGAVWNIDVWSILRGSDRRQAALHFIHYATGSQALARQASEIPYGPTRRSAVALIPKEIEARLPTAQALQADAIYIDYRWWAEHHDALQERFERWLVRKPVYDFDNPDRN